MFADDRTLSSLKKLFNLNSDNYTFKEGEKEGFFCLTGKMNYFIKDEIGPCSSSERNLI